MKTLVIFLSLTAAAAAFDGEHPTPSHRPPFAQDFSLPRTGRGYIGFAGPGGYIRQFDYQNERRVNVFRPREKLKLSNQ
jgi:hypothetical protein